jgi:hypothetical protein
VVSAIARIFESDWEKTPSGRKHARKDAA